MKKMMNKGNGLAILFIVLMITIAFAIFDLTLVTPKVRFKEKPNI